MNHRKSSSTTATTATTATPPPARPGRRGLLALLALAQLMVILDISAVNVALPDLARDLRLGPTELSWTITSYSVMFGSLLLLGGRAADLLGRRRMFLTGLGVFTVASAASALAGSAASLFAARAGQGVGAAMLSPAALSIITASFDPGPDRTRALGVWGAVGGAGAAVGVLVGGVLTELVDWRAIFLINLPIGLFVGARIVATLDADGRRPHWRQVDLPGALVATLSVGAIVFALSQAQSAGWLSAQTLGVAAAGLVGLLVFAVYEARTSHPLLNVRRLADRAIGGGFVLMLAGAAVLFGSFLLTSLYLQTVLGANALETGLGFLPFAVVTGGGVHAGTRAINHYGPRVPLAIGFALTAGGMLLLTGVSGTGNYITDVMPGMLIAGVGLGMVLVSVAVSVLAGARNEESGMLSGLNTTGHEIGGSIGLAVLTSIAVTGVAPGPAGAAAGIADAFVAAGVIAAAAGLLALVVLPGAQAFAPKLAASRPVSIH